VRPTPSCITSRLLLLLLLLLQCFQIPLVRHLYWWIGIRPITRHWIRRLLHKGLNVVLVPGGVQVRFFPG
jgi:hypothetical protein